MMSEAFREIFRISRFSLISDTLLELVSCVVDVSPSNAVGIEFPAEESTESLSTSPLAPDTSTELATEEPPSNTLPGPSSTFVMFCLLD